MAKTPSRREWQGLKPAFQKNSSYSQRNGEGLWLERQAPFTDKSEGRRGPGTTRGWRVRLCTAGQLDAPLSLMSFISGDAGHDGKASAETSPSSLGRQLYDEMALPARKTRPPPLATWAHSFMRLVKQRVQNYLFQWKQLTDVSKLNLCGSCVVCVFLSPSTGAQS